MMPLLLQSRVFLKIWTDVYDSAVPEGLKKIRFFWITILATRNRYWPQACTQDSTRALPSFLGIILHRDFLSSAYLSPG
jgi:hypothetical protein